MQKLLGMPSGLLRKTAYVLLLALSVTTVGPVLHGDHDTDYEPVVIFHDESQHRLASPSPDINGGTGDDHCVACHFMRTSRGPVSWEPTGLHALGSGDLLIHSDGHFAAAASPSPQPARAPPLV